MIKVLLQVFAMSLYCVFTYISGFFYFMSDGCQFVDRHLAKFLRFALFGDDNDDGGSEGGVCG